MRGVVRLESLEGRDVPSSMLVTNGDDAGAGSFRAAIEAANADSAITTIIVRPRVDLVELASSVEYTGTQTLSVRGGGATIAPMDGDEHAFDLFVSSGGADLELRDLTFRAGEDGVFVPVPGDATGIVSVALRNVNIEDSGLFGLHIDDQSVGSDASIELSISGGSFTNNGTEALDFDGIRVDEGGAGDIIAVLSNVAVDGNGADGLELDERGEGSVDLSIRNSSFDGNGFFNEEDLDDGIDIDEADAGNVFVSINSSTINGNFDEGLDLNEDGDGSLQFLLTTVTATGNHDEGIKADELGGGDLIASLANVRANDTVDEEGIALTEEDGGGVFAAFIHVTASGNAKEGIEVSENGDGDVSASFFNVTAKNNGGDGLDVAEAGAGSLGAFAARVSATGNDGFGIKASQETVGGDTGVFYLMGVSLGGNTDGETDGDGVEFI
jgi:hypothetical protein